MHRFGLRTMAAALSIMLVVALAITGFGIAQAQDDDVTVDGPGTPRPGHIHAGTCEDGGLGDIVFPLNSATIDNLEEDATAGDAEFAGSEEANPVYVSVTTVEDVTLDDILAEPHAINFHLSDDDLATYITCGEIGGFQRDGTLYVGLVPVEESTGPQFAGSAILVDNGDDTVTVQVQFTQIAEAGGDTGGDTGAVSTPVSTPIVEVPDETESAAPSADETAVPSDDGVESAVPSADESAAPSADESAAPSENGGESVAPAPSDDVEESVAPAPSVDEEPEESPAPSLAA